MALKYTDSMIAVANQDPNHYSSNLALAYYSKGDILFALDKYDESFAHYHQAKQIMLINKDDCLNSDYSYRIAMVLYKQGKYADAGYFFKESFAESVGCKKDFTIIFRRQELLNNRALCYAKLGKIDSALMLYQEALAFVKQNDTIAGRENFFEVAKGVIYGNMGGEYFKKKDIKPAELFLKKSIAINSRPGYDNNDAALTQVKLIRLYLSTNNLPAAELALTALSQSIATTKLQEALVSYHLLMSQYLEKVNKKEEAYSHLLRYQSLTDALEKKQKALQATDINERFRNLDSKKEIDYLKKEQQLQTTYLYITVVFGLMALVIILLIYFYWKKSRKTVRILTQLNNQVSSQKEQLQLAFAELENSDKEKDSLLRAVAHDLRNPIGGISSLVGMMMEEDRNEETKQQHRLIKETCVDALELINELIEAAENQLSIDHVEDRARIDFVTLVRDAVELLKFKAQEKGQVLKFSAPQHPVLINLNREKILRVVNNLISNAIKFSFENKQVEITVTVKQNLVQLAVIDHGIGIPEAIKDAVFQTFTKAKREGTHGERSYGLGLSISKKIVNDHQGKIWFTPNEQGGSSFYFSLPLS